MKKLQNVKKDHEKRIIELEQVQTEDRKAAEIISRNEPLVEQARLAIQTAIANQVITCPFIYQNVGVTQLHFLKFIYSDVLG